MWASTWISDHSWLWMDIHISHHFWLYKYMGRCMSVHFRLYTAEKYALMTTPHWTGTSLTTCDCIHIHWWSDCVSQWTDTSLTTCDCTSIHQWPDCVSQWTDTSLTACDWTSIHQWPDCTSQWSDTSLTTSDCRSQWTDTSLTTLDCTSIHWWPDSTSKWTDTSLTTSDCRSHWTDTPMTTSDCIHWWPDCTSQRADTSWPLLIVQVDTNRQLLCMLPTVIHSQSQTIWVKNSLYMEHFKTSQTQQNIHIYIFLCTSIKHNFLELVPSMLPLIKIKIKIF